jgi:hypothetical protein
MVENILKRIRSVDSLISFLKKWGLWGYIAAAASIAGGFAGAVWAWLESQLPYWGIFLVFLTTFALLLICAHRVQAIWLRQKARTIDVPRSAKRIRELASRMKETLVAQSQNRWAVPPIGMLDNASYSSQKWEVEKNQRIFLSETFLIKHRGDLIAELRIIATITESKIPFEVASSIGHRPMSVVSYLEAVASLFELGLIDEVKKMDNDFLFFIAA